VKIKKGCRVKIVHRNVFHIATAAQRNRIPFDVGNNYNIYGTVISGSSGQRGWDVQIDIFPLEAHTIKNIDRKKLTTVAQGEEEKLYDHKVDDEALPSTFTSPAATPGTSKPNTPQLEFLSMPSEDIAAACLSVTQWGKQPADVVEWTVQKDDEFLDWCTPNMEEHEATDEFQFEDATKLGDLFFENIFPSFSGRALLLDKYLSDERADFHQTYINEKMKCDDTQAEDRDWQFRQCYTLLIAGAMETENGVDNLWKKGAATGRQNHPDCG
jgi:hypothetical protein